MPQILKMIMRIIAVIVWCLLFGYGALLLVLGYVQTHELKQAKSQYTAITVEVTELEHAAGSKHTQIVVLQPAERRNLPKNLGKTIATTTNPHLALGDSLTMYYNVQNPEERIIDFQTAAPMLHLGMMLTGAALAILLLILLIKKLLHKRSQPTVIAE